MITHVISIPCISACIYLFHAKNFPIPRISNTPNMVFRTVRALSCHRRPTNVHPITPNKLNIISYKCSSRLRHITARITRMVLTHFTYHVRSCRGVTLSNCFFSTFLTFLYLFQSFPLTFFLFTHRF